MESTTTSLLGTDFLQELILQIFRTIDEATTQLFRVFWNLITLFLLQHWVAIVIVLFVVLVYAIIRAILGHWWILGSVLYNYLYFGSLFVIGLIFGPEIFANTYFEIFLIILYISCYILVGKILRKTGLKRF